MSLSETVLKSREKEAATLKSFIAFSLIGSFALHIGLLVLAIFAVNSLLVKAPLSKNEPIEVTIVETPAKELANTPIHLKQETLKEPKNSSSMTPVQKLTKVTELKNSPVVAEKQFPIETIPTKNFSRREPQKTISKTPNQELVKQLQTSPTLVKPIKVANQETIKKSSTAQSTSFATNSSSTHSSENERGNSSKLQNLLRDIRDSKTLAGGTNSILTGSSSIGSVHVSRNGTGINEDLGRGSGTGTNSNSGRGSSNGTGTSGHLDIGNGNEGRNGSTVATSSLTPRVNAGSENSAGTGDNNNSENGRAACREDSCRPRYPESARRRGIEGRVEVSVDTDERGNVTNVHIAHSSGNHDLDEETLRQARDWKLKPTSKKRQGVSIATEYALEGSQHYRELQERKRQTQAQQTNQSNANNSSSTTETPRRRRRLTSGTIADVNPEPTRQRESVTPKPSVVKQRESISVPRRQNVESDASSQPQATPRRRRRGESDISSPSQSQVRQLLRHQRQSESDSIKSTSQNRLRDSLRRYQQRFQSQPPVPTPHATNN
ncbi:MAG: TonB family protein [Nostoc sp.]|uniref:TonB family protein n=1 Tax=Nostoc sp. TaxID=1180 RepID=UPI002FEE6A89